MENEKDVLKDVDYFVEADSFAQQVLWSQHHKDADLDWEQDPLGLVCRIRSEKFDADVWVTFSFVMLCGKRVAFYNPTSTFVDWDAVKEYIALYVSSDRTTDADNFNECKVFCQKMDLDPNKMTCEILKEAFDRLADNNNGETLNKISRAVIKTIGERYFGVIFEFEVDCGRYGRHDGDIKIYTDRVVMGLPENVEAGDLEYAVKREIEKLCERKD